MTARPILMNAVMVRAVLSGQKTVWVVEWSKAEVVR